MSKAMSKLTISWRRRIGRREEALVISEDEKPAYAIPARYFYSLARGGIALLRHFQYGTFKDEEELSLHIRRAQTEHEGLLIVSVYANDEEIVDIWCDKITTAGNNYLLYLKGIIVCGISAKEVRIEDDLLRQLHEKNEINRG